MESDDDFFGEDDNYSKDYMPNKESERENQKIFPVGYQDGIEIGKDITLQKGFNEGFKEGSKSAYKWSTLIGLISSVDVFYHQHRTLCQNQRDLSFLEELVEKLNRISKEQTSSPSLETLKEKLISFSNTNCDNTTDKNLKNEKDDDLSCCGSNNNNNGGCCKSNSSTTNKYQIKQTTNEESEKLFKEISQECVDALNQLGLDGKKLLQLATEQSLLVTTN